jgi:hypothetical protein
LVNLPVDTVWAAAVWQQFCSCQYSLATTAQLMATPPIILVIFAGASFVTGLPANDGKRAT